MFRFMGKATNLGAQERLDWLRLARSSGIGPVTIRDLIGFYGTAAKALEALPDLVRRGGGARPVRICTGRMRSTRSRPFRSAGPG
jgi:DNA processing protein